MVNLKVVSLDEVREHIETLDTGLDFENVESGFKSLDVNKWICYFGWLEHIDTARARLLDNFQRAMVNDELIGELQKLKGLEEILKLPNENEFYSHHLYGALPVGSQ